MNKVPSLLLLLLLCIGLWTCQSAENEATVEEKPSLNLDLEKAEDNLTAFVKIRGSMTPGEEVVFYADGYIYGFIDGERDKRILGFEMYNLAQLQPQEDGSYQMMTREVGLYTDPSTGEILEEWENPYTGETVDVLHVWNDPVNQTFALESRFGEWGVPYTRLTEDVTCMHSDIFLFYPSPLPAAEFPKNSRSDMYEAGEMFQFFFDEKDVNDPDNGNVPCHIAWTRVSPFLPWMDMGDRPGHLVYNTRGYKIQQGGFKALPQKMQDYVMAKQPQYATAPTEYTKPNETSWTYFKKQAMAEAEE